LSEKNSFRVRLMRWGDSSSSGRTVTLKLPDDTEDHPFKGLDVGSRNGQLMEMEITLLEGDAELKTLGPKPAKHTSTNTALPSKNITDVATSNAPSGASAIAGPSAPAQMPTRTAENSPEQLASPKTQDAPSATPAMGDSDSPVANSSTADPGEFDAYANQMSNAAESLAAVAEEMSKAAEDTLDEQDQENDGPPPLTRGQRAVVRAVDLCKSIDQQRAGFFYFMMSRYPSVPNLQNEPGNWSRDAKVTRDRVCHHSELDGLKSLEENTEAREKFEALENEFERHERLR
jgi:hypothetical protein